MLLLLHPPFLSPQQITPFNAIRCGTNSHLEDGRSGTGEQWEYSRRIALDSCPQHRTSGGDRNAFPSALHLSALKVPVLPQAGFIHPKLFASWEKLLRVNMKFFLTGFTDPSLVGRDGATTSGEQVRGGSSTGKRCQTPPLSLPVLFCPNGQSNPRLNISLSCATCVYEAFTSLE